MKKCIAAISIILLVSVPICRAQDTAGQATFKTKEAIIQVTIHSSIYTYKVTNLGTKPVVAFKIEQHASYDFIAPVGWEKQTSEGIFKAYTNESRYAIEPQTSGLFSLRVSSRGAVLGKGAVKITFESGETIEVPEVWVPVAESKSYIALVAGMIAGIIVIHAIITARKSKQSPKGVNGV